MNKKQKWILIVFTPIVIFVIALGIATSVSSHYPRSAFDWVSTWYVWMFALSAIAFSEYYYFKD